MMITEESISTHPPSGVLARNVKESRNCNKASLSNLDSNVELKGNIENEVTLEDIVPWILVWNLIQKIMLIVCLFGDMRQHRVTFNSEDQSVECSCQLFQFLGILCCHAIRVLNHLDIIVIPPKYIIKRWTKQARSGCVLDNKGQIIKEDPNLVVANRFKDLCRTSVEIAGKAAECGDATSYLARKLVEIGIEVGNILSKRSAMQCADISGNICQSNDFRTIDRTIVSNEKVNTSQAIGIKKKDGVSRPKEKKYKRRKDTPKCSPVGQKIPPTIPIPIVQEENTVLKSVKVFYFISNKYRTSDTIFT
ncbi:unnamed protein product [Trifolium pratense]|uniref:Uncharacterized protein n=1 Tax=Trifolium pratense TaxID=57577 RepID=A0ACB0KMH8_TRIPR|nr:unnamed protein product [Trifolium pratense]